MNATESGFDLCAELVESSPEAFNIARKIHPRRYSRFKDLRPLEQACEWARGLDWRNNPYDRFLLRREILHYLETELVHEPMWNVYTIFSRAEIAAEVDRLLDEYSENVERIGVFIFVMMTLPERLTAAHGHGQPESRLDQALGYLQSKHSVN